MKITIVIDAPHYIGGMRYIERFIKILSLTDTEFDLNLIYVNCKTSLNVSGSKSERFIKIPNLLYRLDRLIARFTGISFFSLYLLRDLKNSKVFFSDVFLPEFLKKLQKITLIHWFPDFQVYDLEHLFPKNKILSRKLYIRLQLQTCDFLLTQSETDQERMKLLFPQYANKIVKWSFAEPIFEVETPEKLHINEFELKKGSFLLYPHQGWAHKNHLLLIKTLQSFNDEILVLTGRLSDPRNMKYTLELNQAIQNSKVQIVNLGLVSSNELNLLMKNAKAILNFSSYEGWTSCVEEGIMLGTPLILSNIEIHKEQFAEALFVDISDEDTAVASLKGAISNLSNFKGYNHSARVSRSVKDLKTILARF